MVSGAERARRWLLGVTAALLAAWPLLPSESIAWTGDGLLLAAAWSALGIAWAAAAWRWREMSPRGSRVDAALALFLALYIAAGIAGVFRAAPRPALNMLFGAVAIAWSYWLPRQLIRTAAERRALAAMMVGLAVGVSLVACYQFFVSMPADRANYAVDPDAALREAGLWYPPGSRERWLFEQRLNSREPFATFSLTNSMAGFLTPWTVVAAAIVLGSGSALTVARRWAFGSASPVILLALLLSKSRAALGAVGLSVAGLAMELLRGSRRVPWKLWAAGGGVVVALLVVATVTGGIDREVLSEAPKSLGYRWMYWQATLPIIAEEPLLGCGPGGFDDAYMRYKSPLSSEEIKDPHNFVLEIAATAGIPAAAVLIIALGLALWPWTAEPDAEAGDRAQSAPWGVVLGAGGGLVVAALIGPAQSVSPATLDWMLAAAGTATTMALLWPWVRGGALSGATLRLAALALLVNLLAAGGITYPGVAASLALLLALLASTSPAPSWNVAGWRLGWLLPLGAALVMGLVEWFGVMPVLKARVALLTVATEPQRADELYRLAAEGDPYAYEPWQRMLQRQVEEPEMATPARVDEIVSALVARKPRSSAVQVLAGRAYAALGDLRRDDALRGKALAHFREAARLYPTSPAIQAELARAAHRGGEPKLARESAAEALRLDAETPHADVKLPLATKAEMERLAPPPAPSS